MKTNGFFFIKYRPITTFTYVTRHLIKGISLWKKSTLGFDFLFHQNYHLTKLQPSNNWQGINLKVLKIVLQLGKVGPIWVSFKTDHAKIPQMHSVKTCPTPKDCDTSIYTHLKEEEKGEIEFRPIKISFKQGICTRNEGNKLRSRHCKI